ncbi:MAG: GH3 auxin-responsive promoter family protein, partial [Alistipes sp.]
PNQGTHFGVELDRALRELNSDYDAKRTSTLDPLRITVVPRGTFMKWLRARGKNKVPRLTNDRKVAEEIMMIKL